MLSKKFLLVWLCGKLPTAARVKVKVNKMSNTFDSELSGVWQSCGRGLTRVAVTWAWSHTCDSHVGVFCVA